MRIYETRKVKYFKIVTLLEKCFYNKKIYSYIEV